VGYVERNLTPGEGVLFKTHLHWITVFWYWVATLLLGVAGALMTGGWVVSVGGYTPGMAKFGLIPIAVGIVVILVGTIRRNAVEMAVTNKRVIIKTGLWKVKTIEMFLHKVESVNVEQNFFARIFGWGDIVVRGTGGTAEPFRHISRPMEFRRQVEFQAEKNEQTKTT